MVLAHTLAPPLFASIVFFCHRVFSLLLWHTHSPHADPNISHPLFRPFACLCFHPLFHLPLSLSFRTSIPLCGCLTSLFPSLFLCLQHLPVRCLAHPVSMRRSPSQLPLRSTDQTRSSAHWHCSCSEARERCVLYHCFHVTLCLCIVCYEDSRCTL